MAEKKTFYHLYDYQGLVDETLDIVRNIITTPGIKSFDIELYAKVGEPWTVEYTIGKVIMPKEN